MMNKQLIKVLFSLVIVIAIVSCNKGKEITFYVTNNSEFTKENIIQVYLNDTMLINQNFKYSDIVPNDEVFKFRLKKSFGRVRVVELTYGIEKIDSIDIDKDRYIFIGFNEFKKNLPPGDTVKREISILKRKKYTKLY